MSPQHDNGSVRLVSTDEKIHIGVIGGGAWGTALAMHATRAGHASLIWALEADVVRDINDPAVRENTTYLKVGAHVQQAQGCLQGARKLHCSSAACSAC